MTDDRVRADGGGADGGSAAATDAVEAVTDGGTDAPVEENVSERFDRLPETTAEQTVAGRPTRRDVLEWWKERFDVDPATFAEHSFWEKGNGKLWAMAGDEPTPCEVEAMGLKLLRTRQEHWKPTTNAVLRFGQTATKNVIDLDEDEARAFVAGEDREIDRWDGDWGYLIAAHEIGGERAILGVGLYVHGELRSRVPKGRRREL